MKSIMAASMHKAGSTILDLILLDFLTVKGYEIDRISLQVPASPLPEGTLFIEYQENMRLDGMYYGVARGPYVSEMPLLRKLKIIIQVRDPRDCITSGYFSFKISHIIPEDPEKRKIFLKRRERLQDLDIDQYAINETRGYKQRMIILRDLLEDHEDMLLLKYEDMVLSTDKWLNDISQFVGQPISEKLIDTLGSKIDFSVKSEDASKHKRQVTPGDHKRKLKPETIAHITEALKDELAFFGYSD